MTTFTATTSSGKRNGSGRVKNMRSECATAPNVTLIVMTSMRKCVVNPGAQITPKIASETHHLFNTTFPSEINTLSIDLWCLCNYFRNSQFLIWNYVLDLFHWLCICFSSLSLFIFQKQILLISSHSCSLSFQQKSLFRPPDCFWIRGSSFSSSHCFSNICLYLFIPVRVSCISHSLWCLLICVSLFVGFHVFWCLCGVFPYLFIYFHVFLLFRSFLLGSISLHFLFIFFEHNFFAMYVRVFLFRSCLFNCVPTQQRTCPPITKKGMRGSSCRQKRPLWPPVVFGLRSRLSLFWSCHQFYFSYASCVFRVVRFLCDVFPVVCAVLAKEPHWSPTSGRSTYADLCLDGQSDGQLVDQQCWTSCQPTNNWTMPVGGSE